MKGLHRMFLQIDEDVWRIAVGNDYLDAGQCNDSYSWAVVALKLKEIFGASDINELPIFFNKIGRASCRERV